MDDIQKQTLRDWLYSESPWDLASENDDKFRDVVDKMIDEGIIDKIILNRRQND